jgi:hypothetical protein
MLFRVQEKEIIIMHATKTLLHRLAVGLCLITVIGPVFGWSERIGGNLVLVPASKLPAQARMHGDAMTLHLVDLQTLYLYIEQNHGRNLAVFDVRNPGKVKFKKLVSLNAPAPFDFVQLAGPNSMLIRYRDGSGEAILDLRKPRAPQLRSLAETPTETYIIPVGEDPVTRHEQSKRDAEAPRDYQIVTPNNQPVVTIKAVIQEQNDVGNETTYLLGADGLTVLRNIRGERKLAAMSPPWTNTIDDY